MRIAQHVGLKYIYGNHYGVDLEKAKERAHELFVDLQKTVIGVDHNLDTDKDFRITWAEFQSGTAVSDWGFVGMLWNELFCDMETSDFVLSARYHRIASNDRQVEEAISPADLLWELLQRPDLKEVSGHFVFGSYYYTGRQMLEEDNVAITSGLLNYIRPSIPSDKISEETEAAEAGFEFIRALVRGKMDIGNLNVRVSEYEKLREEHMRNKTYGTGINGLKI